MTTANDQSIHDHTRDVLVHSLRFLKNKNPIKAFETLTQSLDDEENSVDERFLVPFTTLLMSEGYFLNEDHLEMIDVQSLSDFCDTDLDYDTFNKTPLGEAYKAVYKNFSPAPIGIRSLRESIGSKTRLRMVRCIKILAEKTPELFFTTLSILEQEQNLDRREKQQIKMMTLYGHALLGIKHMKDKGDDVFFIPQNIPLNKMENFIKRHGVYAAKIFGLENGKTIRIGHYKKDNKNAKNGDRIKFQHQEMRHHKGNHHGHMRKNGRGHCHYGGLRHVSPRGLHHHEGRHEHHRGNHGHHHPHHKGHHGHHHPHHRGNHGHHHHRS